MQRDDIYLSRIFINIFITALILHAVLCIATGAVYSVEYKVDRSVIEKYAGDISIIKNAEATISILESLVGRKVRDSQSKWTYNLFYPAVKVQVGTAVESAGRTKTRRQGGLESKLIGVVVGRMGSFAIFTNKLVKEGEKYGEIKVVRVDIDRVLVETGDGVKELIVK